MSPKQTRAPTSSAKRRRYDDDEDEQSDSELSDIEDEIDTTPAEVTAQEDDDTSSDEDEEDIEEDEATSDSDTADGEVEESFVIPTEAATYSKLSFILSFHSLTAEPTHTTSTSFAFLTTFLQHLLFATIPFLQPLRYESY